MSVIVGCQPEGPGLAPGELARVDGELVTAADLQERFWQGPREVRTRAMAPGGRRYLLDLVIDEGLLHREATRRGLSPQLGDLWSFHERLMGRFLDAEFERTFPLSAVPDEAVAAEYEVMRPTLVQPPSRRVRVYAARSHEEALALHRQVKALHDVRDEPALVELLNEQQGASTGAQEGVFELDRAVTYLGEEVTEAAWAVDVDDGVVAEPVRYHEGWAVVLALAEHEGVEPPPLSEVSRQMRQRAHARLREEALNRFVETFSRDHQVTVDTDALRLVDWVGNPPEEPAADEAR